MASDEDKPHIRVSGDIMGVPMEASTKGGVGIDEEVLRDRVEHGIEIRVQSWIESCATQVFLAVFFAGLCLGISVLCGYAVWRQMTGDPLIAQIPDLPKSAEPAGPVVGHWDGLAPFECAGHQQWTLSEVTARLPGQEAVIASGHCELTLLEVDIEAGIAVKAGGHAKVTVVGGRIVGTEAAVKAGGSAEVTLEGAEATGARETSASARIVEP